MRPPSILRSSGNGNVAANTLPRGTPSQETIDGWTGRRPGGPIEETNHQFKTLERQAYGYRDTEFFELTIYALREAKWRLIGDRAAGHRDA